MAPRLYNGDEGPLCMALVCGKDTVVKERKRWAQSSNGPDEIDIETMMRAMGALHSGVVTVAYSPLGTGSSGGVQTVAEMHFHVLPGSSLPSIVGVTAQWPCNQCKSFWGHIYHLLHALDVEIGRVYKQDSLWK